MKVLQRKTYRNPRKGLKENLRRWSFFLKMLRAEDVVGGTIYNTDVFAHWVGFCLPWEHSVKSNDGKLLQHFTMEEKKKKN
ncbi:hypothetical protein CEXT_450991 [Caerostris extrusa]|uniref:Uncharacterized protein n=1 Tax=Caerostris extrusa TaxID=172846 RepID=A0AAV4QM22_CAEEX|nr:hypothetical protein CEXT_450991 [Caerostris extrusa]